MLCVAVAASADVATGMISGKVLSADGEPVDYVSVYLKGTEYVSNTNDKGLYHIKAPAGEYTIIFSSVGFEKYEAKVTIKAGERSKLNVKLKSSAQLARLSSLAASSARLRTRLSMRRRSTRANLSTPPRP